jgi:hypothetical protein
MNNFSQQPPAEKMRGCKEIATEAKNKKLWIYDPSTRAWYTPEEFLEKFGRILTGQEKFLSQVQILHPDEGVKGGFKRMLDLQIKMEDFVARVTRYYRGNM